MTLPSYTVHSMGPMSIGLGGGQCTIVYEIAGTNENVLDWIEDRYDVDFIQGVGYQIKAHMEHPLYNWMTLSDVSFESLMGEGDKPLAEPEPCWTFPRGIKVTETYEATNIGVGGAGGHIGTVGVHLGKHFSHQRQGGGEIMDLPNSTLLWASDSSPVGPDVNAGIVRPRTVHTITLYGVPRVPKLTIALCIGKVSGIMAASSRIVLGNVVLPDCYHSSLSTATYGEALLFDTWGAHDRFDENGVEVYDVTYTLIEKATWDGTTYRKWNDIWRGESGQEWDVPKDPDLNTVYGLASSPTLQDCFNWANP